MPWWMQSQCIVYCVCVCVLKEGPVHGWSLVWSTRSSACTATATATATAYSSCIMYMYHVSRLLTGAACGLSRD